MGAAGSGEGGVTGRLNFLALLLASLVVSCSPAEMPGQSAESELVYAKADDVEVNAAMKAAKDSLPEFWSRYDAQRPGDGPFLLKVALPTRDDDLEYIWMFVTTREPKITGALANAPVKIDGVSEGSTVTVTEDQISDWTYVRDEVVYGQFTTRVFAGRAS